MTKTLLGQKKLIEKGPIKKFEKCNKIFEIM